MRVRILKPLMASLVLATAGAVSTPAWAGSASADLLVTATVIPSCVISTTPVAFGVYDPVVTNSATAVDSSGTVTIACTKGSSQTITLDQGSNADGSTRRMSDGLGEYMTYELYQDSARSQVWGTGANAYTPGPAPSSLPRSFTVHGRLPGAQDATVGAYTDIVVATVNF